MFIPIKAWKKSISADSIVKLATFFAFYRLTLIGENANIIKRLVMGL